VNLAPLEAGLSFNPRKPVALAPYSTPINTTGSYAGATVQVVGDEANRSQDFRLSGRKNDSNINTDEDFAKQNIFAGVTNSGPSTMSYVDQNLEMSFPISSFYAGGGLLMRAITPFRGGDTVTFQGEITGKTE